MANNLMDPCLIMNRRIEQRQEHSITHTEITERRVTQDDPNEMQHYKTEMSGPGAYHGHSNGHPGVEHSPHSSHMSLHSEPVHPGVQLTSQKVIHELSHQHGGSDTQSLDYVSMPLGVYPHAQSYVNYNHHYGPVYGGPVGGYHTDYEHYAGPPSPSERSGPPSPHLPAAAVPPHVTDYLPVACYDEYSGYGGVPVNGGAPYDEEQLHKHVAALSVSGGMRWRDPNLTEVIGFLDNPNSVIKANAAAYLQHLCYMDDPNKQRTRVLGGIPPLVRLLASDSPDVYRNACGALRNLSYGRQNDENKRAIRAAGGVPALVALLERCAEADVRELVTGVVWNLSSCEDLKRAILDDAVSAVVATVVLPHSGWEPNGPGGEPCWSTVFRNASGVLRNVSSAGEYARKRLRDCEGLVDALLHVVRAAIDKANIGNKIVENCVCVLRNLSYRCQEVEDPHYDRNPPPAQSRVSEACSKSDNLGCFGGSKKKRESGAGTNSGSAVVEMKGPSGGGVYAERREVVRGAELLWQPDVVQSYLALLQSCSNPETLEAAAGALQNLSACYWQPSIEIRAAVRKEKGLPILVELLRMEVDRVVCAVATALRNLAIDQRNKELIGKYAMRDLTQKLPSGNAQHDQGTSDDTIAAVLATLNEVIKKNAEFSRSLLESGGVDRLVNITRQRQKYTPRVLKFAGQVLFTMWQHAELRDVYKKHGWKETDFITKTVAARNAAAGPNSPNNTNNTLNRPMASQGGTRYEDRTIKRGAPASGHGHPPPPLEQPALYQRGEDIPMSELGYSEHGVGVGGVAGGQPVASGVRVYPPGSNTQAPTSEGEPLYAQVNLEKKRNRHSSTENHWRDDEQARLPQAAAAAAAAAATAPSVASAASVASNSWV